MTKTMIGDKREFKWTHGADKNFENLKQKVAKLLVLALPNFNKVFQVECDVGSSVIGVVLSKEGKHVAFFIEKFNGAKKKYFLYDQEVYAIAQALKKWRHYFIPKEFVLYTNHKAL